MASPNFCDCPISEIGDITPTACADKIGIIEKMAFCRLPDFQTATPPATVTTLATLSEWADTLSASDDTKTVITDFLSNVVIPQSDINTEELNQVAVNSGNKPPLVTALSVNASSATISAMRALACESGAVYVYFLTQDNKIVHTLDGTVPQGFRVMPGTISYGTKGVDGSSSDSEKNVLQFNIDANWDANYVRTEPADFNVLTDLTN